MSQNSTDLEIVKELAEEIAEETKDTDGSFVKSMVCTVQNTKGHSEAGNAKKLKRDTSTSEKEKPTLKDLMIKKKSQNLAERKTLLWILASLLGIQLLFMNAVVLLIVFWCVFNWKFFHELSAEVLTCIFEFTKYYVTAVLVELLGGIVYIVHSVFSDKD